MKKAQWNLALLERQVLALPYKSRTVNGHFLPGREFLGRYVALNRAARGIEMGTAVDFARDLFDVGTQIQKDLLEPGDQTDDILFEKSMKGLHPKTKWLLDDPDLQIQARAWVRENAQRRGGRNMTTRDFQKYVNGTLLKARLEEEKKQAMEEKKQEPEDESRRQGHEEEEAERKKKRKAGQGISEWSATIWLHRLRFSRLRICYCTYTYIFHFPV